MVKITYSILINEKALTIHLALINPNNHIYWTSNLEKFEIIKENKGNAGSIAHLHYNEKGKKYVMVDELIDIIPQKYYHSRITGNGMTIHVKTYLEEEQDGTIIQVKWMGKHKFWIINVILHLMKKKIVKKASEDLFKLKTLVETRGSVFQNDRS